MRGIERVSGAELLLRPGPLMTGDAPVGPRHRPKLGILEVEPEEAEDLEVGEDVHVGDDGQDGVRRRRVGRGIMRLRVSGN